MLKTFKLIKQNVENFYGLWVTGSSKRMHCVSESDVINDVIIFWVKKITDVTLFLKSFI